MGVGWSGLAVSLCLRVDVCIHMGRRASLNVGGTLGSSKRKGALNAELF